ncbi:MAG: SDR family NAD(P)-dependent oxidoreductase [Pseudomonadaceae bacterium]|nr:SDR family NAD(P)-dependent oxidoreductase [Pseudomonadaceae bacterium]
MRKTVVITGASSGIGRALALEFAAQGYDLGVAARRLPALEALRDELLAANPDSGLRVLTAVLDVDDDANVGPVLHGLFGALGKVDIVVVNAGVNDFTAVGRGTFAKEKQLLQTNLIGAIATVNAAVEHFLTCGGGQLVGISSLASLQAIPKQAAYCASKAALSMYLDAARIELKHKNIRITKILPGFVKTEIMHNVGKYPFAVSAGQAAQQIVSAVQKGKRRAVVPAFPWCLLLPLFGHFPDALFRRRG